MAIGTEIKVGLDSRAVSRGLARMASEFHNLGKTGLNAVGSITAPFAKLASLLAPAALGYGMVSLAKGASNTASEFEQMRLQFTMFTGSLEGAKTLMNELRKVDIVSNLDLATLGEGAAKLMAFGISAQEVSGIVESLSKISGGSADKFQGLTLAFGQTNQAMRLTGNEARQYVERGWNPQEQIIKRTGESVEVFRKRMEDGNVTLQEVKQSLIDVTTGEGRFAKAHELGATSFAAATSRMQSQWALLQDSFGTGMNKGLGVAFDAITKALPGFQEQGRMAGAWFGQAIVESLTGNDAKFLALGDVIGTAIGVGIKVAVQKAGWESAKLLLDNPQYKFGPLAIPAYFANKALGNEAPVKDLMIAARYNSGLGGKINALKGQVQEAAAGSSTGDGSDGVNKFGVYDFMSRWPKGAIEVKVVNEVETKGGSKF